MQGNQRVADVCSSCFQTHTLGIHSRTVLSRDAEATRCPDGEKATDNMASYREMKAVTLWRWRAQEGIVQGENEEYRDMGVQENEEFLPCARRNDTLWSVV